MNEALVFCLEDQNNVDVDFFGGFLPFDNKYLFQAWRNAMVLDFWSFDDEGDGQLGEDYKYFLILELFHDTIRWSTMPQTLSNDQGHCFTNRIETTTFNGKKKNTKHKVGYSCWHSSYLLFFKLAHGVDYFQCNKIFAIVKPFMNMVFMSLFLVSTLCSEAKSVGHAKIYNNGGLQWLLWFPICLWCNWLHTNSHTKAQRCFLL